MKPHLDGPFFTRPLRRTLRAAAMLAFMPAVALLLAHDLGGGGTPDPSLAIDELATLTQAPHVPPPIPRDHPANVAVTLETSEVPGRLDEGVDYTFVDRSRFGGGVYAASNWIEVGLTQGRSRGDRKHRIQVPQKAVYVYPLSGQARQRLCP